MPVDFAASGVDALTLTGHKLGGPYGVGALLRAPRGRRDPAAPRRRPGARHPQRAPSTPPAIAGFAAAVELAVKEQPEHAARVGRAARRPGRAG